MSRYGRCICPRAGFLFSNMIHQFGGWAKRVSRKYTVCHQLFVKILYLLLSMDLNMIGYFL